MEDSDMSKINARCIEVCCATSTCLSKQCRAGGGSSGCFKVVLV